MDLEKEWLLKMVDKLYLEEEVKAEKNFRLKLMSTILLKTLKKRMDFVNVSKKGKRSFSKGFILQKYKRNTLLQDSSVRVGFTITKKIGGAVVRNKIKRRFRAIIKDVLNKYLKKNYDYVIIANKKSLIMDYKELKNDVIKVLK